MRCTRRRPDLDATETAWKKETQMFLIVGIVLVLLWLGGFLVFHTAGFLIHILLVLAVASIIFHFLRGNARTV